MQNQKDHYTGIFPPQWSFLILQNAMKASLLFIFY